MDQVLVLSLKKNFRVKKYLPLHTQLTLFDNERRKKMPLIDCPECSKSISSTAESCPSCGYPLTKRSFGGNSTRKVVLIVAMCLGVFGGIVGFAVGNPVSGAVGAAAVVISGIRLALKA